MLFLDKGSVPAKKIQPSKSSPVNIVFRNERTRMKFFIALVLVAAVAAEFDQDSLAAGYDCKHPRDSTGEEFCYVGRLPMAPLHVLHWRR